MGNTVTADGTNSGVTENNFAITFCGRITIERGNNIGMKYVADNWQLADKISGNSDRLSFHCFAAVINGRIIKTHSGFDLLCQQLM